MEFVKATAEKRAERLSDIICKAVEKIECMSINTEHFPFALLHRSMTTFVEEALLNA
jgi:hypothetical protein